ncbi:hypothetical protein [Streptomyces sp. CAU 1734]|uniref:hypothetical protein n=1 Tax=Streptomyces sp. CAU 1734 TaxID=3140360 RepID=UPI003261312F
MTTTPLLALRCAAGLALLAVTALGMIEHPFPATAATLVGTGLLAEVVLRVRAGRRTRAGRTTADG